MAEKQIQLDHHHFGKDPKDKRFNLDAARTMHAECMANWDKSGDEGEDYRALLLHTIQNMTALEIDKHRGEIQRFLNEFGNRQRETLGKAIVKSYVISSVESAQEFGKDSVFETKHPRGGGGLFRRKGAAAQMRRAAQQYGYQRVPTERQAVTAAGYGPEGASYGAHLRHQAMLAQAAAVATAGGRNKPQEVKWQIRDKKGNVRQVVLGPKQLPKLKRGESLLGTRGAGIRDDDLTMHDVSFNLIQALAGTPAAVHGTAAGPAVGQFAQAWDRKGAETDYRTDQTSPYDRIKSGADALHAIAGGNPKAQVAVAVGRWAGEHGPQAEKVIGPHARRSAYKYRGLERTPRDLPTKEEAMGQREYHDRLVARISGHIPTRQVHELNLASGYTAPSHGYLMDKTGKVITEAHGYGDDHYLPFKLSGMTRMKDGSYVRTRSTGGPTTEDIYAAAVSGGKKFTVVSRQGVYELAFDPEFTHNKRFGDIALGMSRRYGKILDAVSSGKVKQYGEATPEQMEDFEAAAAEEIPEETDDREQKIRDRAQQMANVQARTGRALHLDGEGYNYALQALASQYPYYLHYEGERRYGEGAPEEGKPAREGRPRARGVPVTGYSRPQDQRFHDVREDSPEGGHLARVGNKIERDTGYVKPRHIKSASTLVGYFDPMIAGESKDVGAASTEGGKVRGDLAFFQNWARNPYNPANQKGNGGGGAGGGGGPTQPRTRAEQEAANRAASGRRDVNQSQGSARRTMTPEASADAQNLFNALQGYVRDKGGLANLPDDDMIKRAGLTRVDDFMRAYGHDSEQLRAFIHERRTKEGMSGVLPRNRRDDEVADSANENANHERVINDITSAMEADPHTDRIRYRLIDAVNEMKEPGSPDEWQNAAQDADPAGTWDPYTIVAGNDLTSLLDAAFGSNEADRSRAKRLMEDESELRDHEAALGTDPEQGWLVQHMEALANADEDEQTQQVGQETARDEEFTPERANRNLHDAVVLGLTAALESHEGIRDEIQNADDPVAAEAAWERKRRRMQRTLDHWDSTDIDQEHDPKGTPRAQSLHDLLDTFPDLKRFGSVKVNPQLRDSQGNPGKQETNLDRLRRDIEKSEKISQAKQFVVSKRGKNYVIRRAA